MTRIHEFEALNFSFSANGKFIAYYEEPNHQICVVESVSGKKVDEIALSSQDTRVTRLAVSSDGNLVAYESNRYGMGQFVQIYDREKNDFLVDIRTGAFPFWITTLCMIIWGLIFGRLCLKPGKPHPMGEDFIRITMALGGFSMMGGFCCTTTFAPGDDLDFLILINVLCALFFIPGISRKYLPYEKGQLAPLDSTDEQENNVETGSTEAPEDRGDETE